MKNLFHLLLVSVLVGCASAPQQNETSPKPVKEKAQTTSSQKTYTLREMGISMEVPAGAEYVNWSADLFTVLTHPLVEIPATGNDYGATIEGSRVPREQVANAVVGKNESKEMQAWLNQFHPKLATNAEKDLTFIRKDMVMGNGDVLCMRATVRSSPKQAQDIKFAKRVIGSVKLSKGDR